MSIKFNPLLKEGFEQNNLTYLGSNTVSLLDVGLKPEDTLNSTVWASVVSRLGTATSAIQKWIIIPAGVWNVSEPLIIPRYTSVYFVQGALLKATSSFAPIVSNGKTVDSVLSGPTDSSVGYWEYGQIHNAFIDANRIAKSCIELWRYRFIRIINPTLWNGLRHGVKVNSVTESTSYELTLGGGSIYNERSSLLSPIQIGYAGLELSKTTDCTIFDLSISGYNYGVHEDNLCGANYYNTVHVWNRPTQGSLHRAFFFESSSGEAYGLYADTPVARSVSTPTLVDLTQDAYGFYIDGSGWTLTNCKIYVGGALDGNGYAYGGDNQCTGVYLTSNAGSTYIDGMSWVGSSNARIKVALGGPNAGAATNLAPRYTNCTSGTRATTLQRNIQFKSQGGPSLSFVATDYAGSDAAFGNINLEFSLFPSPNGVSSSSKEAFVSFNLTTGTTGPAGIRIWDATSDGGSVVSAKVSHFLGVNNVNWLGHSTTGAPIQFVVGRQSAASTSLITSSNLSSRASTSKAVFDFQAPVNFEVAISLPRYTTTQRDALGVIAQASTLIYNTTTTQWEYTEDGTNWIAFATNLDALLYVTGTGASKKLGIGSAPNSSGAKLQLLGGIYSGLTAVSATDPGAGNATFEGTVRAAIFRSFATNTYSTFVQSDTGTGTDARLSIDPIPANGTSNSSIWIFRSVNTTGPVSFNILKGDNTPTINTSFSGNGVSYIGASSASAIGLGVSPNVSGAKVQILGGLYLAVSAASATNPGAGNLQAEGWIKPALSLVSGLGSAATAGVGAQKFATNGRKAGEGAGVGTGVPVYSDGVNWRVYRDDTTVAA